MPLPRDYEDKFALKYAALEQDLEGLQLETQEASSQLQKVKEAKLILKAELRFLRNRVKMLKESSTSSESIRELASLQDNGKRTSSVIAPASARTGRVGSAAARSSARKIGVASVLKTSSKHGASGLPQTNKKGKRKISWQDEFALEA